MKKTISVQTIRKDFPSLRTDPSLVYLDSTATSLKPKSVLSAEQRYYTSYCANVFRGIYRQSEQATAEYEKTREAVAAFIGSSAPAEVLFTRNATEGLNLLAATLTDRIQEGDEVVVTLAEHHSNFVPWQQLAHKRRARFLVADCRADGSVQSPDELVTEKTRIVAFTAVSNVLGTLHPVRDWVRDIRKKNKDCIVIVDAAQAVPHAAVNVQDWGCDAIVFSSHKMLGPTGVGVLWGRAEFLQSPPPYQLGGEMIKRVSVEKTVFADLPHRFEAGTPHIAGVIALRHAVEYLTSVGLDQIHAYEAALAQLFSDRLIAAFPQARIIGPRKRENGIVSFTYGNIHAHDVAQVLAESNIAVRAGHHCAMPLHTKLGIDASVRASFYLYNTEEDVDKIIAGLNTVQAVFS